MWATCVHVYSRPYKSDSLSLNVNMQCLSFDKHVTFLIIRQFNRIDFVSLISIHSIVRRSRIIYVYFYFYRTNL